VPGHLGLISTGRESVLGSVRIGLSEDELSYQVIARKWRPQTFHELVGQDHISTTLLNALRNHRLPQALLFTGPRGTGKTSSARILAKSLRCPNAVDFVPCNVCPTCLDIASSRSIDVIEVDGASNNGVDAVRELRDTVGYMPSSGQYKVYIIDEVHMLSTSAFNALLKTLEEPPAHVIFVLATTEVQKIPSTILSRCQRFDFRRIPSRQIAAQLQKVCEAEGVAAQPEALWLIARQADGSMRDSQSLLDQVITFCDGQLTLEKVVDVLGLTDRTLLLEALAAILSRDAGRMLALIEKLFQAGYDPKNFAQDLLEEIRNCLMVRLCADQPERLVDLPDSEIQTLRELSQTLSEEDLHFLFDIALKGVNDLIRAQDTRVVLEMLLLRMAHAPRLTSLAALFHNPATAASMAPRPAKRSETTPSTAKMPSPGPTPSDLKSKQREATTPTTSKPDDETSSNPWFQFVSRVKKSNGFLGAMLENTHLIEKGQDKLVIGMPKSMSFLFDKLKDPENVRRIEQFLETFWKAKLSVEIRLADAKAEAPTPKAMAEKSAAEKKTSLEQSVGQNALVKSAQNVFKAQIKSIKERP